MTLLAVILVWYSAVVAAICTSAIFSSLIHLPLHAKKFTPWVQRWGMGRLGPRKLMKTFQHHRISEYKAIIFFAKFVSAVEIWMYSLKVFPELWGFKLNR